MCAQVLNICSDYLQVLTESVRDSCTDFAALLHQHQQILCQRARQQGTAVFGYKQLLGKKGLVHRDPQWTAVTACSHPPPGEYTADHVTANGSTNIWSGTAVRLHPCKIRHLPLDCYLKVL
jgi:hypothetical protein